ncbi:MAG: hypothetical protein HY319_18245 [Armatimonadetes bacterium]|nr:hypothetical protein [Armatimonadota bacterium]
MPRERLFRVLDQHLGTGGIWVWGPAGSGKTVLVSSWIEARGLPCLWYLVDKGDADPATFFYYLGLAARPLRRRALPLLTPEYLPALDVFARRWFEALFARLSLPCCLVLDDYQEAGPCVHEMVRQALAARPPGVAVILLSRCPPDAGMARHRANGQLEMLDRKDLQLTREECAELVRRKLPAPVAESLAEQVHRRTQGWAAGVVLMLERMRREEIGPQTEDALSDDLSDYFTSQALEPLGATTQRLLLETSLVPYFDGETAIALTEIPEAPGILSELHRHNYFIERRGGAVYHFHPLFRDFLLTRARSCLSAQQLRERFSRAAGVLAQRGCPEEALDLYRQAADWTGLGRCVRENARALVAQGRYAVLADAISCMPESVWQEDPWLSFWLGLCRTLALPAEGQRLLEGAFYRFVSQDDPAGTVLAWAAVVDAVQLEGRALDRLDRWLDFLPSLGRRLQQVPQEVRAHGLASVLQALSLRNPAHPEYARLEHEALECFDASLDPAVRFRIAGSHLLAAMKRGELGRAAAMVDACRPWAGRSDAAPLTVLGFGWFQSVYFLLTGAYSECLEVVQRSLALAEDSGVHGHDAMLLGHGALACLNAGDFPAADGLLARLASDPTLDAPRNLSFNLFLKAHRALRLADPGGAAVLSQEALRQARVLGDPFVESLCQLLRAHALCRTGDIEAAERCLRKFQEYGCSIGSRHHEFNYGLAKAYLDFQQGNPESGRQALESALSLGRQEGYTGMLLWHPEVMESLFRRALEIGLEPDYVRELIRRHRLAPQSPVLELDWPWPVRIWTLGRFEIHCGQAVVHPVRKARRKPLDLLRTLIAAGGRGVAEHVLDEVLWPDADGDSAHRLFTVTLHRLRELLGTEGVLCLQEGRLSLDPRLCWLDAWAFERYLELGESDLAGGAEDRGLEWLERALGLYAGPFLPSEDSPLASRARRRLRYKFHRAAAAAGQLREAREDLAGALKVWERAIEVEPLAEDGYRRLMGCYQRMGRHSEAVAAYQLLRATLLEEKGAEPEPATQDLYRSLVG